MAHHDTQVRAEDHVIVFVDEQAHHLQGREALFQVSVGFF